jgi:putative ABC transport system permease protein
MLGNYLVTALRNLERNRLYAAITILGLATAIAIPAGFVAMAWWLRGFVYHVDLPAWTFLLAATAAVVIAWLTVSWQSFAVARAKPAGALRCE